MAKAIGIRLSRETMEFATMEFAPVLQKQYIPYNNWLIKVFLKYCVIKMNYTLRGLSVLVKTY